MIEWCSHESEELRGNALRRLLTDDRVGHPRVCAFIPTSRSIATGIDLALESGQAISYACAVLEHHPLAGHRLY
jgi:hypothetical protein